MAQRMKRNVILASTSAVKKRAVERLFADVDDIEVLGVSAPTSIVQPFSHGDAMFCLLQRLLIAQTAANEHTLFIVAVENFVYKRDASLFVDSCMVAFSFMRAETLRFDGFVLPEHACRMEVGVPAQLFPTLFDAHQHSETLDETCGKSLEKYYADVPGFAADDWYKAVGAPFSREDQVFDTLRLNSEKFASVLEGKAAE